MTRVKAFPALPARYTAGTQRLRSPEETLDVIQPLLPACGITRVVDVTRLDRLGIPTCCAIRPTATVMQVSNGKGVTQAAARVSALMESIELFHAEDSLPYHTRCLASGDFDGGDSVAEHTALSSFRTDVLYNPAQRIRWIEAMDVVSQQPAWLPAETVFFDQQRSLHTTTTNGLASGNHLVEASLHGLYELIERDAGARLSQGGRIALSTRGAVIEPESITDASARRFIQAMDGHGKVVVCYVESAVNVFTFWVILLNNTAQSALTALNIGWGTHRDRGVALSRALTEAAQSRLTAIHGAREDILSKSGYRGGNVKDSAAYRYFEQLEPNRRWSDLPSPQSTDAPDLMSDWHWLLDELQRAGFGQVYRFDLTRPDLQIPVVKMIVPGLGFNPRMF